MQSSVGEARDLETIYWFVIDTNRYAGNFERELCAFVTGRYGDCEVGQEVAERVLSEVSGMLDWTEDAICQIPDENGVCRPVRIEQTPGWVQDRDGNCYPEGQVIAHVEPFQWAYQSVAISFSRPLDEEELGLLMQRAAQFQDQSYQVTIIGYRIIEERTIQTCIAVYPVAH
jgi:hypothetical protein